MRKTILFLCILLVAAAVYMRYSREPMLMVPVPSAMEKTLPEPPLTSTLKDYGYITEETSKETIPIPEQTSPKLRVFDWPPPEASSTYTVPLSVLDRKPLTLADADTILGSALGKAGYEEKQYYLLPEAQMPGFVLVTRIEAINIDGSPKVPGRWPDAQLSMLGGENFSLKDFVKVLLHMQKGYYRVIAFVFSGSPVEQDVSKRLSKEEAEKWLSSGYSSLPESVAKSRFTNNQDFCTVLVYEFEKKSNKGEANLSLPSTASAKQQIEKTGIFGNSH